MATFPTARERSTVLQGQVPESHLFSLNRVDWIGQPGVPPTNTQGGVEKKNMRGQNEAVKQPVTICKKGESSYLKMQGGCFKIVVSKVEQLR